MSDIALKDKVVIITGAGGGLGKVYALQFASRGAKVVVNDLGGSLNGSGNSNKAADVVVEEIRSNGGTAVANYDNLINNPEGILKTALDNFGTVDILINNAGILKDSSFNKMTNDQFIDVLNVHLNGAFKLTKLCWNIFKEKKFGRIIMTASPAGLYGNFGQANYSCAKLALVGFGETLAKEGLNYNIKCNIISLLARSRMTESVLPAHILEKLSPSKIAPLVLYLSSPECPSTGSIYEVAAGMFAQIKWQRSGGLYLNPFETFTPEAILSKFDQISKFNKNDFDYPIMLKDYNKVWNITNKLPKNEQGKIKINSLKNKVVIITGAGNGLGKSHALLFAKYGARVVVNDFQDPFKVVEEIKKNGGIAIGSKHDVLNQSKEIVKLALDNFGTVDILINNAGILRDRSFSKMSENEWNQVIQIHILATFNMCKLVWPIFLSKKSGCIINTTSTSGIYGNFGQANYASAKAGILSFTKTLSIEGKRSNIKCNAIAPHAETAMTKTIFKNDELNKFSPSQVSPMVVLLCSEEIGNITGELYEVGAGWIGNTRWQRAKGYVCLDDNIKPESIKKNWNEVINFDKSITLRTAEESSMAILQTVTKAAKLKQNSSSSNNNNIYKYDHHQIILYNISIGATSKELKYVYESDKNFQVLPTFGVIPFMNQEDGGLNLDHLVKNFNLMKLLHGEHYMKVNKFPIPKYGNLKTKSFPLAIINKTKGAKKNVLARSGYKTFNEKGELIFTNVGSYFIRDCESRSGKDEIFKKEISSLSKFAMTDFSIDSSTKSDFETFFKTDKNLAALYRLNGDFNPLHIDPIFAKGGNFNRPILHGLCSYGISAKMIIDHYGMFEEIKGRFTNVVYPGETLKVICWKEGNIIKFQTWVVERNVKVIDFAAVKLIDGLKSKF